MPFDLMLSACLFKKVLYSPKVPPSLCLSEQKKKIPTDSQNLFSPLLLLLEQAPTLFLSLYIIFPFLSLLRYVDFGPCISTRDQLFFSPVTSPVLLSYWFRVISPQ